LIDESSTNDGETSRSTVRNVIVVGRHRSRNNLLQSIPNQTNHDEENQPREIPRNRKIPLFLMKVTSSLFKKVQTNEDKAMLKECRKRSKIFKKKS